jgi:(1->4)-alpha-D-glucan 1-alpha-D-glucosylmutase
MTTLSTHDTKRSDDVRARLAVLTEIPERWKTALSRWSRRNAQFKTGNYPDRNTEYFLYQTLIGAWPISSERLVGYLEKATREAKQQTSWTQPNQVFEEALRRFVEGILNSSQFIAELKEFVARIIMPGRLNSLSQTPAKLHHAGSSGYIPRQRTLGSSLGRSRQSWRYRLQRTLVDARRASGRPRP